MTPSIQDLKELKEEVLRVTKLHRGGLVAEGEEKEKRSQRAVVLEEALKGCGSFCGSGKKDIAKLISLLIDEKINSEDPKDENEYPKFAAVTDESSGVMYVCNRDTYGITFDGTEEEIDWSNTTWATDEEIENLFAVWKALSKVNHGFDEDFPVVDD